MRFVKVLAILLFVMVSILGCGGNGNDQDNPFVGMYRSGFGRGVVDTGMLVLIKQNGDTRVVISDAAGILYMGEGKTNFLGTFSITADGQEGPTDIHVDGTCHSDGTITLTLSGDSSAVVVVSLVDTSVVPYFNPVVGEFAGDFSGTFQYSIDDAGNITGQLDIPAEANFPITGSIDELGNISFGGSGFLYEGNTYWGPESFPRAEGQWTGPNGLDGTWTGAMD